ncbi:PstS family phosphate ABC transporter substrate-binding protein [Kutzneria sp. CA-103260]|uniref:PstS family phosphate ABC transporter substrate-binding protein n=1 Tax=Kutzneria sp. CA-103260 TaxID=2802641 RepID=UPI001BAE2838|nr:substrate-binding domain-containing protein [Kutzneria sp. CA-103260]QUQ71563.1 phosphate binding protein [Kutzneria sp. CA-103260]
MSVYVWSVVIPAIVSAVTGITAVINTIRVLWPSPHRWISYRVHLDKPIDSPPLRQNLQHNQARLVVRRTQDGRTRDVHEASVVVVRVSNDSGLTIGPDDYVRPAVLTFGERKVVGVELSDVDEGLRNALLGSGPDNTPLPGEEVLTFDASEAGDNWLKLPRMNFNQGVRFRMVVLLEGQDHGVKGAAELINGKKEGLLRETAGIGPTSATRLALVSGTLATVFLLIVVLALVLIPPPVPTPAAACANGALVVSGSTAFQQAETDVATSYHAACPGATVSVNPTGHPTGSHQGVLDLATNGRDNVKVRTGQLAMSDGAESGNEQLVPHAIAVIIFSVVVNKAAGVHSLTADQLRQIYSGQVVNWSAVGGANLPIAIVSRGTDSGTRSTFDRKLLDNAPEPPADSYNCVDRDPGLPASPATRCEMQSTGDVLGQVNANPGAIGYAEMSATSSAETTKYQNVQQVQLNGYGPDPQSVKNNQYPFWTVEYFYSYGIPAEGSLISTFLTFMTGDTAKTAMQNYGHIPCVDGAGNTISLCG